MANEVQTRFGTCATHGAVEATREMPRLSWPLVVNAIRRNRAKRRPYRCPECNEPVEEA